MKFTRTEPCDDCPFLNKLRFGFTMKRLRQLAEYSVMPCHKTASLTEQDEYRATEKSVACAGMLIFNEKRKKPNQMMRIAERLEMYDRTKLNMKAPVR